jgi:ElaB/YqjD/DUF883 family membrane-anchored ribosome-binding protein
MANPNLSDSARRTARDMQGEAEHLKSAAQDSASTVMHSAQRFGSDVRHAVQDQFGNIQETASEYLEQGRSKANEVRHTLEDRIRNQPLNSMLIVAGIGFALGFLFTRR